MLIVVGWVSDAVFLMMLSIRHLLGRAVRGRGRAAGQAAVTSGGSPAAICGAVREMEAGEGHRAVPVLPSGALPLTDPALRGRPVVPDGPYADADTAEEPDSPPVRALPGRVLRALGDECMGSGTGPDGATTMPRAGTALDAEVQLARANGSLRAWLWGEQGAAGEFLLASQSVTVGRDPGSDIVLSDLTVSREHATLKYGDGSWWLLPGVTANGTWLNGRLIQPGERVRVDDGGRLRFGLHTQLRMLVPATFVEPAMRFVAAAYTTPGAKIDNSDAHLATERLLTVADGVSDRPCPRIASWTAVREIADTPPELPLPEVIDRVNGTVLELGSNALQLKGMATTLDLVRLRRDETRGWRVEGAHLGDGQVLLQDSFGIRKLTREDTAGGRLAAVDPARAVRLAADPEFNRLTSAVGFARQVDPELWWVHADREQRLVLTTDGLVSALGTDDICEVLRHSRQDTPAVVAGLLIRLAIQADAPDNVTIIVADIAGSDGCVDGAPSPVAVGEERWRSSLSGLPDAGSG